MACTFDSGLNCAADEVSRATEALRDLGAKIETNEDGTMRRLVLDGPKITNHSLNHAKYITDLKILFLQRVKITDVGLASLAALPHLEELAVHYSQITDQAIPTVASMKTLKSVRFCGTQVTARGIAQLEASRPDVHIDYRQGGFLGVGSRPERHGPGVEVARLTGPAKKAGLLQVGDVITHCEGEAVDYHSLHEFIRGARPGQRVSLRIERAGEEISLLVVLGEY